MSSEWKFVSVGNPMSSYQHLARSFLALHNSRRAENWEHTATPIVEWTAVCVHKQVCMGEVISWLI